MICCLACSRPQEPDSGFIEIASDTGLTFTHDNGTTGRYYFAEIMGSGAGLLDFDRDGDLDAYLVQSGQLSPSDSLDQGSSDQLFRNDRTGDGAEPGTRWIDVTARAGLVATGYGMGVAAGDTDNDGWVDLYVTNLGDNQLWRNRGDGTFEDASARLPREPRWSTSASFADLDGDGWLDLFVANYTDFRPATHQDCLGADGRLDYCGPRSYAPVTDRLLLNQRDGTFADLTAEAGLLLEQATGLGAIATDFDGDRHLDLYVANDQMQNHLWHNLGDGTFVNRALMASAAVNSMGKTEASMGVEAADLDNDGDEDLFMTHLNGETNTFYENESGVAYADRTAASGLGPPSIARTGFGTAFLDVDIDGWLDLLIANGAVQVIEAQRDAGLEAPLHQPDQLFLNRGGRFVDASTLLPKAEPAGVGRGLAVGDVDNDGRPDALVNNNHAPASLLSNQTAPSAGWIGARASHPTGRPDLGARFAYTCAETTRTRRVRTDGSYLSARDSRVLFGGVERPDPSCRLELETNSGGDVRRVRWLRPVAGRYLVLPPNRS